MSSMPSESTSSSETIAFDENLPEYIKNILLDAQAGKNILCIGPGGAGKSFILQKLSNAFDKEGKTFEILCPTGQSCTDVNGITYHRFFPWKGTGMHGSFFGLPCCHLCGNSTGDNLLYGSLYGFPQKSYRKKIMELQTIMFDEFSMISNMHFGAMNKICQLIRRTNQPFGGIQLIVFGDPFQLSPVQAKFPFMSADWDSMNFIIHQLIPEKLFRYTTTEFSDITRMLRLGIRSEAVEKILETRLIPPQDKVTEIYYRNSDADKSNIKEYDKIDSEEHSYPSFLNIKLIFMSKSNHRDKFKIEVIYDEGRLKCNYANCEVNKVFDTEQEKYEYFDSLLQEIRKECNKEISEQLSDRLEKFKSDLEKRYGKNYMKSKFKVGTRVICTMNHSENLYVNGTSGKVEECGDDYVSIRTKNDRLIKVTYRPVEDFRKFSTKHVFSVKYSFNHIPLRLGYAITFNRSQGMTIDSVKISGKGLIRKEGLVYVGISRCKALDSLYLEEINLDKLVVNYEVVSKFKNHYLTELKYLYSKHPSWFDAYTVELNNFYRTVSGKNKVDSVKYQRKTNSIVEMISTIKYPRVPQVDTSNISPRQLVYENTESEYTATHRGKSQKLLRDWLLKYQSKCLITGENLPDILEAAHIKNYCEFSNPEESHNGNAILLRCDLHKLFDKGFIAIDEDGNILHSESIANHPLYSSYKKVVIPDFVNKEYLRWRIDNIFVAQN